MRILRIKNDPTRPAGATGPLTTVNDVTHWWDGSSIYGSSPEEQQRVRSGEGGQLRLTADGQLPFPDDPALDPTEEAGLLDGPGHAADAVRPRAQRGLRRARRRATRSGTTRSCSSAPGW